jgi:two-component system OmpR family response regulator
VAKGGSVHILIVDDDPRVRQIVSDYLTGEGYEVSVATDGVAMSRHLAQAQVDLVILDVQLPGQDGLSLAAQLRQRGNIGVLMLSRKDDLVDRVAGLEVGADDYLSKPFHLRELLARVRSVLRRSDAVKESGKSTSPEGTHTSRLRFAGWIVDRTTRAVISPSGEPVQLSAGEYDLLLAFLEHPKRPLSRDQLLDMAHNRNGEPFDRSIDVQVGRLRRKIEANPRRPELIKTVRGVGYVLGTDVERL